MLHRLVFRAPNPPGYSQNTLPHVEFAQSDNGSFIPVTFSDRWSHPPYLHPAGGPLWILFSHGNSEDLGTVAYWADYLSDRLHLAVVAYDYSGFGISRSSAADTAEPSLVLLPSESNLYLDCEAVLRFAHERYGLLRENCIVWGRSLGCCASIHLATSTTTTTDSETTVAGMILQSGFVSVLAVGTSSHWDRVRYAENDMFRNYDKLAASPPSCPTYIIHGRKDRLVNVWHSEQLEQAMLSSSTLAASSSSSHDATRRVWPSLIKDDCGHNDIEVKTEDLLHEVYEFIQYCALCRDFLDE